MFRWDWLLSIDLAPRRSSTWAWDVLDAGAVGDLGSVLGTKVFIAPVRRLGGGAVLHAGLISRHWLIAVLSSFSIRLSRYLAQSSCFRFRPRVGRLACGSCVCWFKPNMSFSRRFWPVHRPALQPPPGGYRVAPHAADLEQALLPASYRACGSRGGCRTRRTAGRRPGTRSSVRAFWDRFR